MFNIEEFSKLYREDATLAKNYCIDHIDDCDAQVALIFLDIENFHTEDLKTSFDKLEKLYPKSSDYCKRIIESFAIDFSYRFRDYKKVIKYAKELLKNVQDDNALTLYYISMITIAKGQDSFDLENLKQLLLESSSIKDDVMEDALHAVAFYHYKYEDIKGFEKFVDKAVLTFRNILPLYRAKFRVASYFNDENEKIKDAFKYLNQAGDMNLYGEIFECAKCIFYDKAELILEMIKEIKAKPKAELDICWFNLAKAYAYFGIQDYKSAHSYFKKAKQEVFSEMDFYFMGESITNQNDRRLYDEAMETYLKGLKINSSESHLLEAVMFLYYRKHDFKKTYEYLIKLEKLLGIHYDDIKAQCIVHLDGDFDEGSKLLRKLAEENNEVYYAFYAKKEDELKKKIFNSYLTREDHWAYRELAIMYFHGFGVTHEQDKAKALSYALKASSGNLNCYNSVLGNIYLSMKEYDKAFKLFEKGYKDFFDYKDNCACCVGFYCYCLMFGLGVTKDQDKAYEILNSFDFDYASDLIIYDYAYLCLERKENLNRAYDLLKNMYEWRYEEGKYFLLIKIAKALNLDYKTYEKKFQDNLNYLPSEERRHYENNPEVFYLTNI